MALNSPDGDPLARAQEVASRDLPEEWSREWDEVSRSVRHRVRSLPRPSRPLLVHAADGGLEHDALGSRTRIGSRVVLADLRSLLRGTTHAPERIDLDIDDERLTGVEIDLVCAYGVDLRALGDDVAARVHERLLELLGPDPERDVDDVRVRVVDVVVGDPTRV